jgi:hypothetical protein
LVEIADPLNILADRPPANIKGNPSGRQGITYAWRIENSTRCYCPKGVCFKLSAIVHISLLFSGA